ncbi:hypothetical protein Tco_1573659, partial [Tanacetum coccineum]
MSKVYHQYFDLDAFNSENHPKAYEALKRGEKVYLLFDYSINVVFITQSTVTSKEFDARSMTTSKGTIIANSKQEGCGKSFLKISYADRNAWADYYKKLGIKVVFSNGKLGMGSMKLKRLAKSVAAKVNIKRRAMGLLPRA